MKKQFLILSLFLVPSLIFAKGTSELSIGVTNDVYIEPDLDITIQGITFADYSYYFNERMAAGIGLEEVTYYSDVLSTKFVDVLLMPSFTFRVGNGTLYAPFVVKAGPDIRISSAGNSFGFKTSFQTGVEIFVNDDIGVKFLAGPFYAYIDDHIFGFKFNSGIVLRF